MIIVTRLNGTEIVVNADLIETVESTPDTIVTLVDGTRYLVEESPATIIERVMRFRAAVLRLGDEPLDRPESATSMSPGSTSTTPAAARRNGAADVVALPTRNED